MLLNYPFLSIDQFNNPVSDSMPSDNSDNTEPLNLDWKTVSEKNDRPTITLKKFSELLLHAEILDNKTLTLQGSTIWLPYGMKLRKVFDDYISQQYEQRGLKPFYYPSLVSEDVFEPLNGLYSLKDKMLCVGIESEIKQGQYRAMLSPTGESTIYSHWAKYIKQVPLPIKMYRNASYFRPISHQAGMGIFNAMEATGVFEFHAAYRDRSKIDQEIISYHQMLENIFSFFSVPRIWTLRPPWTNNAAISKATYGADTLLPTDTSLQVGAIYDQDSIFSERFGICTHENGVKKHTKQLAGFCSRRLLLSSLMISCHLSKSMFIPPRYSPIQIAVICYPKNKKDAFLEISKMFQSYSNLRLDIKIVESGADISKHMRAYEAKGVPLIALIQEKGDENALYQLILKRVDNGQETKLSISTIDSGLVNLLNKILTSISAQADGRLNEYVQKHREIADRTSIEDVIKHHSGLSILPLNFTEESVRKVESQVKGEIIGFVNDENDIICAVTGQAVKTRAVICRRF